MSAVLAVAVKVIVCICVAWSALAVLFVAKCLREAAWDRRHRPVQPPKAESEPIDDAVAMVKAWQPAPPVKRELRNIPRGDGAFVADGLDDAIARIMEEGLS